MKGLKVFKRNHDSSYTLTPVSKKQSDSTPLKNGFTLKRKITKVVSTVLISVTALFSAGLIALSTAPAATAGPLEDWMCDGYKNSKSGWGTTMPIAEPNLWGTMTKIQSQIIGGSVVGDLFTDSQRLTAYEQYGTSGTNFSMWLSVDRENIDADTAHDTMWQNVVGSNKDDANAAVKSDTAFNKLNGNYPASTSAYWADNWTGCVPIFPAMFNGVASFVLLFTETGTFIVNTIYGMALSTNSDSFWLSGFYDALDKLVLGSSAVDKTDTDVFGFQSTNKTYAGGTDGLINKIYLPYLLLIMTISALYLAWRGLVKSRTTEFIQGAIWMVLATIGGWLLIISPSALPKTIDNIVLESTNVVNTAITESALDGSKDLCQVDEVSTTNADGSLRDGLTGKVTKSVRQGQCLIWYSLVYQPWVIGNYGYSPSNLDAKDSNGNYLNQAARDYLLGDSLNVMQDSSKLLDIHLGSYTLKKGEVTWPLIQLDLQSMSGVQRTQPERQAVDALIAVSQLGGKTLQNTAGTTVPLNAQPENTAWKGMDPFPRIVMGISSFLALIGTSILVVMFGFRMVLYQVTMLFLMFVSPFVALLAVHPGFGKRMALKWMEIVASLTAKRFIATVMISIFLMFYGIVMEMSTSVFLIQWIMIAVITVLGFTQQRNILNSMDKISFGGRGGAFEGLRTKNLARKAGDLAVKAAPIAASVASGTPVAAASIGNGVKNAAGKVADSGSKAAKAYRDADTAGSGLFGAAKSVVKDAGSATVAGAKATARGAAKTTGGAAKAANAAILGGVDNELKKRGIDTSRIAYAYKGKREMLQAGKAPVEPIYGVTEGSEGDEPVKTSSWYGSLLQENMIVSDDTDYRNSVDESTLNEEIDSNIKIQSEMLSHMDNGEAPFEGTSNNLYNEIWSDMDEGERTAAREASRSQLNIMKSQRKLPNEVTVDVPDAVKLPPGLNRKNDASDYNLKYSPFERKQKNEWLFGSTGSNNEK